MHIEINFHRFNQNGESNLKCHDTLKLKVIRNDLSFNVIIVCSLLSRFNIFNICWRIDINIKL